MQFEIETSLAVLSAMITPAVLISACGSLLIATSNRIGRVIDRTRKVSEQFERLAQEDLSEELAEEERGVLFRQLDRAAHRSRLLQRAMLVLYTALAVFVAASVAIGVHYLSGRHFVWLPLALGLLGAGLLFAASLLLILEARIALSAVHDEMDFVLRMGRHVAPRGLLQGEARRRRWFER